MNRVLLVGKSIDSETAEQLSNLGFEVVLVSDVEAVRSVPVSTLRDEFAIASLPQCMRVLADEGNLTQDGAAGSAYAFADAMMKARHGRG
jgi:hypothetical protein